jgi:Protein of unknown function (DUF2911)
LKNCVSNIVVTDETTQILHRSDWRRPIVLREPRSESVRDYCWQADHDQVRGTFRAGPSNLRRFRVALEGLDLPGLARAGANAATTLVTGADLDIGGVCVPAGTYTLYVLVKDPENWKLIVNRQTGQSGHIYSARMDLGRVDMKMGTPKAPVEKLRYTITTTGNTGTIQLEWENHVASVRIRAT